MTNEQFPAPETPEPTPVHLSPSQVQALLNLYNQTAQQANETKKKVIYEELEFPVEKGSPEDTRRQRDIGALGATQSILDGIQQILTENSSTEANGDNSPQEQ